MKLIRICSCLIFISACCAVAQDWELVWWDDFDYNGLPDISKWENEVGLIRNNELQYYTERRIENSVVQGGELLIVGRKESYKDADFTSASLTTVNSFNTTYGKIEAKIKLQKGQGLWPAFWLLGTNIGDVGWPACGEIDILEQINNEEIVHSAMHWHNNGHKTFSGSVYCDVQQYQTYAIEWDESNITWFLNDNAYLSKRIDNGLDSTEAFHKPFYLILNLAIGGNWPGSPDTTTIFPDTMRVDYVRVYKKSNHVSINNMVDNFEFSVFPNPASGNFTITFTNASGLIQLSVFDIMGNKVLKQNVRKRIAELDLSYLPAGLYVVNSTSKEGSFTKKVLIY